MAGTSSTEHPLATPPAQSSTYFLRPFLPTLPLPRLGSSASESAPGAQVVALYEVAEDGINEAGWSGDGDNGDGDAFRVAVVVTGSHFAEEAGFDSAVRCIHRNARY